MRSSIQAQSFVLKLAVMVLTLSSHAAGQTDNCQWDASFARLQGMGQIYAMQTFDAGDGCGNTLYAGGEFSTASGAPVAGVVKRDGLRWVQVGDAASIQNWNVRALAVHDDGSGHGPQLYAAGQLTITGQSAQHVLRKLQDEHWMTIGTFNGQVLALSAFDDGSGRGMELYAGGMFGTVNGMNAAAIAKWDGASWQALPALFPSFLFEPHNAILAVRAFTVFDRGNGPELVIGGQFGFSAWGGREDVAAWNGTTLTSLRANMYAGSESGIHGLAVHDDGKGPALYAGGQFYLPESEIRQGVAKWTGDSWQQLGEGMYREVRALQSFDDGRGAALYIGGPFLVLPTFLPPTTPIGFAKWDGKDWIEVGGGVGASPIGIDVRCMTILEIENGAPQLCIGGDFGSAGNIAAFGAATWDGEQYTGLGIGLARDPVVIRALEVFDGGINGPALYVAGNFVYADDQLAVCLARFDGAHWSPVGQLDFSADFHVYVDELQAVDAALFGKPVLLASGRFNAGGNEVVMWDGHEWSALGTGLDNPPQCFQVHDDGTGLALYAGGQFFLNKFGTMPSASIVRLENNQWLAVGSLDEIETLSLVTFDDGTGMKLYAGGTAPSGGCSGTCQFLHRWDGSEWTAVEQGFGGSRIMALEPMDAGAGTGAQRLVAARGMTDEQDVWANRIGSYAADGWQLLGSGTSPGGAWLYISTVNALERFDEGAGESLFAAGQFHHAGEVDALSIARWDGNQWSAVGAGIGEHETVVALTAFQDALYVGGYFTEAGGTAANGLARWICAVPVPGDVTGDQLVNVDDLLAVINAWGPCAASCAADLDDDADVDVNDLLIIINNWH